MRRPTLRDSDLSLERQVVLEEISTVEDTPDDEVFDLAYELMWPNHPYGFQILGTKETVSALSTDDLRHLHARAYFPGNCIIAAAGNLTHDALLAEVEKQGWFDGGGDGKSATAHAPPAVPPVPPAVRGVTRHFEKDTAQTHIVFGGQAEVSTARPEVLRGPTVRAVPPAGGDGVDRLDRDVVRGGAGIFGYDRSGHDPFNTSVGDSGFGSSPG